MNIFELAKFLASYDQRELLTLKRWIQLLLKDETRCNNLKNQIQPGQYVAFYQSTARRKIRRGYVVRMYDDWVDIHHAGLQFTMPYFAVFLWDFIQKPLRMKIVNRPATHHYQSLFKIGMHVAFNDPQNNELRFGHVVQINAAEVTVQIKRQSFFLSFNEVRQVHNALLEEKDSY